jgi:hypothetical protein
LRRPRRTPPKLVGDVLVEVIAGDAERGGGLVGGQPEPGDAGARRDAHRSTFAIWGQSSTCLMID